jgi:hypothetical protein
MVSLMNIYLTLPYLPQNQQLRFAPLLARAHARPKHQSQQTLTRLFTTNFSHLMPAWTPGRREKSGSSFAITIANSPTGWLIGAQHGGRGCVTGANTGRRLDRLDEATGKWKQSRDFWMTQEDARSALAKLFLVYSQAGDSDDRKAKMLAYWNVLRNVTPCYTIEACEYAAKGKLGDPKFMPSAGELYQCAQELSARAVRAKRVNPRLEAPSIPPAERVRVAQGLRNLAEELRRNPMGSLACTPGTCPKKYGAPCPNRGTGVCRETTERRYG